MNEIIFTACLTFIIIELITFLSGGEKTVRAVCSVSLSLIVISSAVAVAENIDLKADLPAEFDVSEEPLYLSETQRILKEKVNTALETAGIFGAGTELTLSVDDTGEVQVDSLKITVRYRADKERAKIISDRLFSGMIDTEVILNE